MSKVLQATCISVSLLFATSASAQIKDFLFGEFKKEKEVTYGLNNRRTRIFEDQATIYGAYAGIQFGDRLQHVITLNSTLQWVGDYNGIVGQDSEIRLDFVGFSEEFVFAQSGQWSFSSYMHAGGGVAGLRTIAEPDEILDTQYVWPLEGGVHSEYSVNTWLSFRGGAGYRYVVNKSDWPLHGIYIKVGAGVNFKELKAKLKSD